LLFATPRTAARLSLLSAVAAAAVLFTTALLVQPSLPDTTYFGGSSSLQVSAKPLRLGGNLEPEGFFQGLVDDVRIYGRALTAEQIRRDMDAPVSHEDAAPDLVAAYNFDATSGASVEDLSGHGNVGRVIGATATVGGHSGRALVFNGVSDVVVIPSAPSLMLSGAMTLEAWIYPTAAQRGWRAVIQKEFDDYFLLSGSRLGVLKPAGGGTFGASTEILPAPIAAPLRTWTYVAATYERGLMVLYVNGRPVARRLRWYPGHLGLATLDGVPISPGIQRDSGLLRQRLLAGATLKIEGRAVEPLRDLAPVLTLHDASRNEIFLLAVEGEDLVLRVRSRSAALEMDRPAIRARGALRSLKPGDAIALSFSRTGGRYCVGVNGRSDCGLGYTIGVGWAFFIYSQIGSRWHEVLNIAWMFALGLPLGFWLRARWESLLALVVLAIGLTVPFLLGDLGASFGELCGVAAGVVVGCVSGRSRNSCAKANNIAR
jgi:hypothetical protein